MKIIETDNLARDYPDERVIAVDIDSLEMAEVMAEALVNRYTQRGSDRFYRVVADDYKLSPGFPYEPETP